MLRSMYKKIIICCSLLCSVAAFSSCDTLLDAMNNNGSSQSASDQTDAGSSQEQTEDNANEASDETDESKEAEEEPTDEAGGNPEDGSTYSVEITVSENKYIYDNHEISYDELIEIIDALTEADVVKIYDDNAALDTYSKLTAALEERGISYIEDTELSGGSETEE